ncbi:hypothetical protein [Rhizobium phage RHph_X2_28B]|nr:hypothetical protein PP751_gp093 [Rhizobium phage RHph_X2_28B]QWY83554.1 hypothetical protein [Rhizobium phage RHph_X2_28B]
MKEWLIGSLSIWFKYENGEFSFHMGWVWIMLGVYLMFFR